MVESASVAIQRAATPTRILKAKPEASLQSISTILEKKFDHPERSVKLVYPNDCKSDATIGALRQHWDKSG